MGRPIKSKFFGNRNSPYDNEQTGGPSGIGGESIGTITVSNSGTNYSSGTIVTINAPQLVGGVPATISYSRNSAGNLTVNYLTRGKGYASASLTVTKAATVVSSLNSGVGYLNTFTVTTATGIVVGMLIVGGGTGNTGYVEAVTGNIITTSVVNASTWTNASNLTFSDAGASFASSISLTSNTQNALAFTSFLLAKDGGANAVTGGDILKQESSRRYLVKNSEGVGQVKLVAAAPATGEMSIIATDTGGATYYVIKLTAHKATLVNIDGTPLFADNATAGWTLGSAALGVVSIASL
jgi:hypothetical protein